MSTHGQQRSFWSGKKRNNLVAMSLDFLPPGFRIEELVYVESECQDKLKETLLWIMKSLPYFYLSIFSGTVLSSIFLAIGYPIIACVLGGLMGLGLILFPFTTPLTIKMAGLRNSLIIGRVAGLIVIVVAILAAVDQL